MNKTNESRITSEVDFTREGKHHGFLRLPHSVHRSAYGWIPIPVTSVKNGEGPRMLLMAGNHGDEYEGQVALAKLTRGLDPGAVRGQVIILPMANFPAAKAGLHRYVQSLRAEVRYEPLTVTELDPGYIDTDMNRSVPNRPFVIPVERGAAIMARMIERGVGRRYVPMWPWMFVAPLLRVLPTRWLAPRRRQQR